MGEVARHLDPSELAAFCGNAELIPPIFLIFVLDFCPSFLKGGKQVSGNNALFI